MVLNKIFLFNRHLLSKNDNLLSWCIMDNDHSITKIVAPSSTDNYLPSILGVFDCYLPDKTTKAKEYRIVRHLSESEYMF